MKIIVEKFYLFLKMITLRVEVIKFYLKEIYAFVDKYNNLPTKETLIIELGNRKDITEEEYKAIKQTINGLSYEENDIQWLLDTTEKFCKDKAVNNAYLTELKSWMEKTRKELRRHSFNFI